MKPLVAAVLAVLLLAGAAAAKHPETLEPEKVADRADKIICKRFPKTGQLVGTYRTCKSKHEWERERENLRQLSVSDSCRDRANGGALCPGN